MIGGVRKQTATSSPHHDRDAPHIKPPLYGSSKRPALAKGQGREAQKLARRKSILEVAAPFFLERGFDATCMSDIAATVGGSKATLWTYFPSKEHLFFAVIDHCAELYRESLGLTLREASDLATTISQLCRTLMLKAGSSTARQLMQLWLKEGERFPEIRSRMFHAFSSPAMDLIADYCQRQMDCGLLRCEDPQYVARTLVLLCHQNFHDQIFFSERTTTPELNSEYVADIFLRAFSTRPDPGLLSNTGML